MSTEPTSASQARQWSPACEKQPRSIFGNFGPEKSSSLGDEREAMEQGNVPGFERVGQVGLQPSIDLALARSFLYRWLAQAFDYPSQAGWQSLASSEGLTIFESAMATVAAHDPAPGQVATVLVAQLKPDGFDAFHDAYLAVFGHAARGSCPLNEIEYGDLKADGLFQPHRLADLAAFYRAFGLEVSEDAGERQDHLCLELEFMCVLAAKEAYALEHQLDEFAVCRDAQKRFLREHLGRWVPAFARRLARSAAGTPLAALADLTRAFVESEGRRLGVRLGSEDLMLRPVDEASEKMCGACGK